MGGGGAAGGIIQDAGADLSGAAGAAGGNQDARPDLGSTDGGTGGGSGTGGTVSGRGGASGGGGGGGGVGGSMAGRGGSAAAGSAGSTAGRGGAGGAAGSAGAMAGRGGGGGNGGGGAGGSTTCSVSPVNPNASPQARRLLCYLYSLYGKNVLSGQQETSWSNPANDVNWYNTNVGKYPAILGGDYLYPNGTTSRAQAYWNAGGITMIRYHMGAPPGEDTYDNSLGSANIANVLSSGTNENNSFREKLDYIARELQTLENANVAVLWAPFHEYQPSGWFWWSKGTATQFIQLWKYMYDYLTTTKGLNNLVWLAPSSGSPNGSWYPGKAYVDVAGPDTYGSNQPFTSMFAAARSIIGTAVPIALHETGVVPQPASMFPTAAPWVLWNIWAGYQTSNNSLANIRSAYDSSYTITRDEVPNLR
jgi:hypothetical protein